MKNSLITTFLFAILFAQSYAQPLDKIKTVKEKSAKVAELFSFNKIGPAVESMAPYWSISDEKIQSFKKETIEKMAEITTFYGGPTGYSFVKEQQLTDFTYKAVYFVRFNLSAMRLTFYYYKNNSGWTLNNFAWDMDWDEEFD